MMKKNLFVLLAILSVSPVTFGQTDSPVFNDFIAKYQELDYKLSEYFQTKSYNQAELILKEGLALVDNLKLPENEIADYQQNVNSIKAIIHYNLACIYSLKKQKKQAISAFAKAVELGYADYRHVLADSDFDNIRNDKQFIALVDKIKVLDKLVILQNAGDYQKENTDSLPKFRYQPAENGNLKQVRDYFKLDSVAGNGDELSKIFNILSFIHNTIRHDGNNFALCEFDAIDLYNYHKATGKGINCRHLSIALMEMYLSMGIKSRYVTCRPKDPNDGDCHVINSVYSNQLQKWIWIDPTNNAYVKDENGNLLSIAEVRERLRNSQPLVLNEDANWNNEEKQTREHYLETYMAKNLYWFQCVESSWFNPESRYRSIKNNDISLLPEKFEDELPEKFIDRKYLTHDAEYFWQAPENK